MHAKKRQSSKEFVFIRVNSRLKAYFFAATVGCCAR